jgi:hypothetical protein
MGAGTKATSDSISLITLPSSSVSNQLLITLVLPLLCSSHPFLLSYVTHSKSCFPVPWLFSTATKLIFLKGCGWGEGIFLLLCINCTRGFHCDRSMHIMCFDQIHPFIALSLLWPLCRKMFSDSLLLTLTKLNSNYIGINLKPQKYSNFNTINSSVY